MRPIEIYVAVDAADTKYYDELVRHIRALRWDDVRITSKSAVSPGKEIEKTAEDHLLSADIIVLLVTARFGSDTFCSDTEVTWALARHRAGDALVFVIQCGPRVGDLRLLSHPEHLRLEPERPRTFSSAPQERAVFWRSWAEQIRSQSSAWLQRRRPHYDDDDHRRAAATLSRLCWRRDLGDEHDPEGIAAAHRELRLGGRLRAGDILSGRFWLLVRRTAARQEETWAAYDRVQHRSVVVHAVRGLCPSAAEALQRRLERLMQLRSDAFVRVRAHLCEERDLGIHFFAMDASRGRTLRAAVIDGSADASVLLRDIVGLGEALAEAHELGMAHGDIHHGTILYEPRDASGRPALRVAWPIAALAASAGPPPREPWWESDVHGWIRAAAFCLCGSELPWDVPTEELRHIIRGQACSAALKELLASQLGPGAAPLEMGELVRRYQRALDAEQSMKHLEKDLEMVSVGEECFWLGARDGDPLAKRDERPAHRVHVGAFRIARYPVTQRLYSSVMGENPSAHVDDGCPVHNVTFRDAVLFCNKLSKRRGLEQAYLVTDETIEWDRTADGYRLLTEAEWELAAKGPADRRLFPWGDEEPAARVCWKGSGSPIDALDRKRPSPVWNHPDGASPYGVLDMCGNVWEWCWDPYSSFQEWSSDGEALLDEVMGPRQSMNPRGKAALEGAPYRVLRGGAWNVEELCRMRTTSRSTDLETQRDPDIGFRLALGAKPRAAHVDIDAPASSTRSGETALPAPPKVESRPPESSARAKRSRTRPPKARGGASRRVRR
jgi:eukaryotic-like serine/threonine-protein kinase